MATWNRRVDRLMDLERTVDALNGQLRVVQWELQQQKSHSLTERLWRNFLGGSKVGPGFMSTVCNRRVRPNTRISVDHH